MAAVIGVGGVFNLARIARPWALDVVLVVGVAAAFAECVAGRRWRSWRFTPGAIVVGVIWLAVAGLVAHSLVPPAAYNVHDDLEKYFALPVRMLATGTLGVNPLSSLGAETLGAQAFLHGFVAAHFPLTYLGALDTWFGLLLCLGLVGWGRPVRGWGVGAVAAMVIFLAVDPLIVNVSALFSGVALMATAILLGVALEEAKARPLAWQLLGLVYAALVALKPTFGVFAVVHVGCLALLRTEWGAPRWASVAWSLAGAVVGLMPWVVLHAPLYLHSGGAPVIPPGPTLEVGLFSGQVSDYGTTQRAYTLVALVAGVVAVAGGFAMWRGRDPNRPALAGVISAGVTASVVYLLMMEAGAPAVFGPFGATRYAVPLLLAALPCGLRLLESETSAGTGRWHAVAAVGVAGVVVWGFLPSTVQRPSQWWRERLPLVFLAQATPAERSDYLAYNRAVFRPTTRARLDWLQEMLPAGEPLVAWVSTPFLLDYRRNPIFQTDPAGLSQRWTRWPEGAHYVLLEHRGFAVRPGPELQRAAESGVPIDRLTASRALVFLADLQRRARGAKVLVNDGTYVLLRLEPL
ncbi:hypothetical protein DB354_12235 [Opitutus sp. ER46]|nr:hypothetical protein DB354_12235 [Opitutus sp. ER46]